MAAADPVIVEPIMLVTVLVPNALLGTVQGDLQAKRGVLVGLEYGEDASQIQAEVPLSAMFGYSTKLRSLTSGQGNFSMGFSHYQPRKG